MYRRAHQWRLKRQVVLEWHKVAKRRAKKRAAGPTPCFVDTTEAAAVVAVAGRRAARQGPRSTVRWAPSQQMARG
jgi:hypothetical protein